MGEPLNHIRQELMKSTQIIAVCKRAALHSLTIKSVYLMSIYLCLCATVSMSTVPVCMCSSLPLFTSMYIYSVCLYVFISVITVENVISWALIT